MIPCSKGSNVWYMSPCSNKSNIQGILRVQLGTDEDWENIPKNIHCDNSLQNIDRVYDCVHVNGCVRYDSSMTGNTKPRLIYDNIV